MSEERCAMCKEAGFPDVLAHFKAIPKGQAADGKGRPALCWDHKHGKVPRLILEAQGKKAEDKVDQRPLSEQIQEKVDKNAPAKVACKRKVSPDCETWVASDKKQHVCAPCRSWMLQHGKPGKQKFAVQKSVRGPWQVNEIDEGALSGDEARALVAALWRSATVGEKFNAVTTIFDSLPMVFRLALVQTIMKVREQAPAQLLQPHPTVQERGANGDVGNSVFVPAKDRLAAAGVEEVVSWDPEDVAGYISVEEMEARKTIATPR